MSKVIPGKKKKIIVGLITNQTGVDQHNVRNVDILAKKKVCDIKYIFVPEHGLNGIAAERDVPDSIDNKTHIPVVSLYGNGTGKMISPEHINELDVLLFDIQDSGMRHYTYISTLLNTMKIAAEYHKIFMVLDRPNPLGGLMQGPLVEPNLISFISIAPIPLRHGMTIGELARYFNKHLLDNAVNLHVVTMSDYNRSDAFAGPWLHQLSPNIQSLQSCFGYSFLGLVGEVAPFDVGIGTDMAFRCIMLPENISVTPETWRQLKKIFNKYKVKNYAYKQINPKTGKRSRGLRLEFSCINEFRSFELFIEIMQLFKNSNIPLLFSSAFNKAVGSVEVQDFIMKLEPKELLFKKINKDLQLFRQHTYKSLLYN